MAWHEHWSVYTFIFASSCFLTFQNCSKGFEVKQPDSSSVVVGGTGIGEVDKTCVDSDFILGPSRSAGSLPKQISFENEYYSAGVCSTSISIPVVVSVAPTSDLVIDYALDFASPNWLEQKLGKQGALLKSAEEAESVRLNLDGNMDRGQITIPAGQQRAYIIVDLAGRKGEVLKTSTILRLHLLFASAPDFVISDPSTNIFYRVAPPTNGLKNLVIGSHLDSDQSVPCSIQGTDLYCLNPGNSGTGFKKFEKRTDLSNVVSYIQGGGHQCALQEAASSTKVLCWGDNSSGQLGTGNLTLSQIPVGVNLPSGVQKVLQIVAGQYFNCLLGDNKSVYCWGSNGLGQMGLGTTGSAQTSLEAVSALSNVRQISAGLDHACALTESNRIFCWGAYRDSSISAQSLSPKEVVFTDTNLSFANLYSRGNLDCVLTTDGQAYCWGLNTHGETGRAELGFQPSPIKIGAVSGWTTLSLGYQFVCGVTDHFWSYCWGSNASGIFGSWDRLSSATPINLPIGTSTLNIFSGTSSVCSLDKSGEVGCWGKDLGDYNVAKSSAAYLVRGLPVNTNEMQNTQVHSASDGRVCALRSPVVEGGGDGYEVWCWGGISNELSNFNGSEYIPRRVFHTAETENIPLYWSEFIKISPHPEVTCDIQGAGLIYCAGFNDTGQLTQAFLSFVRPFRQPQILGF